jgi:hypothetical protein
MDSPRESAHDNGKNTPPAVGFRPQNGAGGFQIKVQPPRREDLQPSYAQTLQGDEEQSHGWYGGMSTFQHRHRAHTQD